MAYLQVMKKLLTLIASVVALGACLTVHPAPLPKGAIACGSDWDCPSEMHCGFPHIDSQAQCMPGGGDDRWGSHEPK